MEGEGVSEIASYTHKNLHGVAMEKADVTFHTDLADPCVTSCTSQCNCFHPYITTTGTTTSITSLHIELGPCNSSSLYVHEQVIVPCHTVWKSMLCGLFSHHALITTLYSLPCM